LREYLNLRYQLIPYLFSESIDSAASGLPLLRPLVLDYQSDPTVHAIDDQFTCGRGILVAPIMQEMGEMREEASRTCYLPEGVWYDFFSKEPVQGKQWITRDCPLERIPVWLKGGSVIPLGPTVQSTNELTDETPLEFVVLLDQDNSASGEFHLNRKSCSILTAKSHDGKVVVTLGKGLPVKKMRVFGQAGEIAEQDIIWNKGDS
jgi:alpha-glucosidase (family GH31 glycosyl hydrolase)